MIKAKLFVFEAGEETLEKEIEGHFCVNEHPKCFEFWITENVTVTVDVNDLIEAVKEEYNI